MYGLASFASDVGKGGGVGGEGGGEGGGNRGTLYNTKPR